MCPVLEMGSLKLARNSRCVGKPSSWISQPLRMYYCVATANALPCARVSRPWGGATVFRSAMTLRMNPKVGGFTTQHFAPLDEHFGEQTVQTHVMAAYAAKGIDDIGEAQRLAFDYFAMDQDDFMKGGCRVEAQSSGGRRHHHLMRTSSKQSATRRRNRLSATTASKLMSLSSQVRVPARPASWCIGSHTLSG